MKLIPALLFFAVVTPPSQAATISVGQTENFESGGLAGFSNGGGAADPVNNANGGPAGAGDNFMSLSATGGSGSGSKLTVFNRTDWAGNFSAVNGLEMDVNNLGATTLNVRISLNSTTSNGAPSYVSTENITLAPGSGWQRVSFSFASMIPLNTPQPLATLLANVAELRISHATTPTTNHGEAIAGSLGVDNITAIPEPSAAAAFGLLSLIALRRRR